MTADALIVGGGIAGPALAIRVARAGRHVVLLEREAGPHHKVCGEFLSREAVLYLTSLGLDLEALGAERIGRVRLARGRRVTSVDLPFPALSLSRRTLDWALLRHAAEAGAELRLGARVAALDPRDQVWRAKLQDGEYVEGQAAFLATGKHDLRGWPRPAGPQSDMIGFKLHWRLAPDQARALAGHVELMLFPGGYAGLEPVEGGLANLCLVVRRRRFTEVGQCWDDLLGDIRAATPLLDQRLAGAGAAWERPLAIAAIPYGHIALGDDGLWRLGDQAAVIPSFSGDGMSIALHSARLAADFFLEGADARQCQRRVARDVAGPVRFATALSRLSVRPLGSMVIAAGATLLPGTMTAVAAATRVPGAALRRAGIKTA